jgi:dihydroxy-acid dehydratase
MGAVLSELAPLLHLDALTVTGERLGERLERIAGRHVGRDVVRPRDNPIAGAGGLIGLSGSLAPEGALLKRAAATPALMEHTGRAVVFSSLEDLAARIDDPALDVTADDVLVLQNAGPRSPSGMPEAGYLPIPKKLAAAGVKDMVRISDARMSGTAFGTIVLHVTPEAADGGPLALVRNGDRIALSAARQRIDLLVGEAELARRRAALPSPPAAPARGYQRLYAGSVLPATEGCDFDFLRADGAMTALQE